MYNFFKYALADIIGAIGAMHNQVPFAARPYFHLADGIGKAVWPPPVGNMFWVGPHFPNQFHGSIQSSCDPELPVFCIAVISHFVLFLVYLNRFLMRLTYFPNAGGTGQQRPILLKAAPVALYRSVPCPAVLPPASYNLSAFVCAAIWPAD